MRQIRILSLVSGALLSLFAGSRGAEASCALPNQLTNGQTADATQVMANFAAVVSCLQAAPSGPTNALQFNAGSGTFGGIALTNGQLIIGTTGGVPQAAGLTAGAGIAITNGPGSITISGTAGGDGFSKNRNITVNAPTSSQFAITSHYGRGSSATPLTVTDDVSNGLVVSDQTTDNTGWKTILRNIPGTPTSFTFGARVLMNVGQSNYEFFGLALVDANGHMASWVNNERIR
jgi:hypothetical protein